jgi:succinyl-diaminopimelate desuccinylase
MVPPPDAPLPTGDLLALTAALVDIASPSFSEATIVEAIEAELRLCDWLTVDRVGDNVVARTDQGHPRRLILAGHTDTVPANGNEVARVEGDRLYGVGSADMKGGVAVMLELARTVRDPAIDVTYVFYAREEVAAEHSGLSELYAARPDLLVGDAALLGEPTSAAIEAGCQGTLRMEIVLAGARAHTARPWMGRNAIHRLGALLAAIDAYEPRRPILEGCEFREALSAVSVTGGVAGNVVPDRVELVVNHRFAPDRTPAEAEAHVRELLVPFLEEGDTVAVLDAAGGAWPAVGDPVVQSLIVNEGLSVGAKLGWTDASTFSSHGVPAANFGPGDATIAHTAGEFVERAQLDAVHRGLLGVLSRPS